MAKNPARANPGLGQKAEAFALDYLKRQGLDFVAANYRCRRGEIDLVMHHGDCLVFVEVRFRSKPAFGSSAESITVLKQRKLAACASHFLQRQGTGETTGCRFDVLALTPDSLGYAVDWIQDAFRPD